MIDLLTDKELAARLKLTSDYLRQLRTNPALKGRGPPFLRVGRAVRYRVSEVDAWLDRQAANTEV